MRRITKAWAWLAAFTLSLSAQAGTFHTPKVIDQEMSLYRNIVVSEGDGYRCMTFGRFSGRQSCIHLADPQELVLRYSQGLMSVLYVQPQPQRVLVIGLGGGMLPMTFRHLYPGAQIDTVDLDPSVVKIAKTYFGFTPDDHLHAYVDDGRMFVRKQGRAGVHYDVIIIDAFDKDYIPEHMLTVEFLAQVKAIMAPHGVLAANTFQGALTPYETATYQAVFGAIDAVDSMGGNRIVLAARDGLPDTAAIIASAQALDARLAPTKVTAASLLPGLMRVPHSAAQPLTDQYSPANLLLKYAH
jgi:spermidine synthase